MLVDTSGLLCLLDPDDAFHDRASTLFAQAPVRVAHNYVLAELIALANSRRQPVRATLDFVRTLLARPDEMAVVWADEQLTAQALILLQSRIGAGYSLCDAVSFVLMRQRRLTAVLTTDADFEQEGFQRLLA